MTDRRLALGKLPVALLGEILASLPAPPSEVLLGPRLGEDAAALALPGGVLVVATDPITMTGSDVGRHAVLVNANDVAVTGARPRWMLAAVLLPEGTRESAVRALFASLREGVEEVGAVLVGGHTEVTRAVTQPVVVGQMLGQREHGFVSTGGLRPGDVVLQVGPAPVEGAAVLAIEAADRLGSVDPSTLERARRAVREPGICIVEPALRAAAMGATALHDPTEGGVSAGLWEMAEASGVRLDVDADALLRFEPGFVLCEALGLDPWGTLASGTLLAGFPADRVDAAERALRGGGDPVARLARASAGSGVVLGGGSPLARHERDQLFILVG